MHSTKNTLSNIATLKEYSCLNYAHGYVFHKLMLYSV